ncbi:MAG: protein translocase subunit SecD [Acidimicrobiales bacterium]|nr:protein translocase subunit SecD [Acidimicrobiales bacterium]
MTRLLVYLGFPGLLALVALALLSTTVWDNEPLLGLDLQGGVSMRLIATEVVDEAMLDQTVEIIRDRVDGLGVAEPEVSRIQQGVMVSLPGVDNPERALALVGTTAEMRFRPVCAVWTGGSGPSDGLDPAGTPMESCDGVLGGDVVPVMGPDGLTPPEADQPDHFVVLALNEERGGDHYLLGPSVLTGDGLSDADADFFDFEWQVGLTLKDGAEGIGAFNAVSAECFSGTAACPRQPGFTNGRLAIVLDGKVITAPQIRAPGFERDAIVISGGFDKQGAEDVALSLRYGALPVELEPENTQVVSATIGEDSLDAGIRAGIIGLALVAAFMLAYYRLLGLVALASLAVSGTLLWGIIAYLGTSQGLALTLAGVTGIIVAVGVSVDSNIVYFEHLKEDVRDGRTARSAVDRAFKAAFSTIVKANTASLIGAGLLYWMTVGAVKGFALYLGLATILDLYATFVFMRPVIHWLAKRQRFAEKPQHFGLPVSGAVSSPILGAKAT